MDGLLGGWPRLFGFGQLLQAEFEGELDGILGCTDTSSFNYINNIYEIQRIFQTIINSIKLKQI